MIELLQLSSQINRDEHVSLWKVTEGVSKKLTEVSEMCLAFLKNEIQIICFLHLNQLSNISSLKAVFISPRSNLIVSEANTSTSVNTNGNAYTNNVNVNTAAASKQINDTTEAEIVLDELIHHIGLIYNVFKNVLPREIISIIMSPLCTLIPRILIK